MKFLTLVVLLIASSAVFGQKKTLDHTAYNDWKKVESQVISNDGNFISYHVTPLRGDGYVYLYHVKTGKLDSIPRGMKPEFTPNSNYLIFKISAGFDTLRTCELKKIDKAKWPKDSLGIYDLVKDTLIKIPNVKSYALPKKGDWLVYSSEKNDLKTGKEKKKKKHYLFKKNIPPAEYKSDGKVVTVYNPVSNKKYFYKDVTQYVLSEDAKYIALIQHQKVKKDSFQLAILSTETNTLKPIDKKRVAVLDPVFNKQGSQLAYFSSMDTNKVKVVKLNVIDLADFKTTLVLDTTGAVFGKDRNVSSFKTPAFTEDGKTLFFGVTKTPKPEPKDTILESEKPKLDLWHYQDKRIQPQQLVELKIDEKRTDSYAYHFASKQVVRLSNDTLSTRIQTKFSAEYSFASAKEMYQPNFSFEYPTYENNYRVNNQTGAIELLKMGVLTGKLSPSGNAYVYFSKGNFYHITLPAKKETCMTCTRKDVRWTEDNNGAPHEELPLAILGWNNDESLVFFQSEYDVWSYAPSTNQLTAITGEEGKKTRHRFTAYLWETDSIYWDASNVVLYAFDEVKKGKSVYTLSNFSGKNNLQLRYQTPMDIVSFSSSKNKQTFVLRKSSLQVYPDLIYMNADLKEEKRISNVNPQQSQYNWSTVELVHWKAYDGTALDGLIYKPADFDPTKKYPMIVYYYELHSDDFNRHYAPRPSASTINPNEYASAGYVIFIPDIRYKIGYPAKSAYNAIMSGTDYVLKLYPNIDSTKLGLQGQSWGGYQTLQLITMTNRYAAAMAGAPVANMISAYGGIRWGAGISRQFQYEHAQSRIGKTIWDGMDLYVENSPLFHLPKVKTPLLVMANDQDGAVPWYQGIELYMSMRRLNKPCWMLNYNGDDHNLTKNANKIDLSIRMRQFFDYYLQGKPAPTWLTEGIPAIDKGKKLNY